MAMTVIGTLGTRAIGGVGWVDGAFGAVKVVGSKNLRRMIVPGIIAASKSTFSYNLGSFYLTLSSRCPDNCVHPVDHPHHATPPTCPQALGYLGFNGLYSFERQ
jgi:hypothetical protein